MKFKNNINFTKDIIDAGYKRIKDIDNFDFSKLKLEESVTRFVNNTKDYNAYIPGVFEIFSSFRKNESLKNLKYFINILSVELGRIEKENDFYKDYIYSLVKKIESESLSLEAITEEKEIKFFYGASKVCYNNFTRENDFGLNEQNRDFMIDHKTKFFFEEKEKLSVLKNLGITLPIEGKISVPIVEVEIINEETTSGDTLFPIEQSNPMNIIRRNKTFNYSVLFKEMDNKRKYKREHASLCLMLKLGSVTPLNNLKVISNSIGAFNIESISYIDGSGSEIKINEYEIENTFESNYIFKPIETDTLILKIVQKTPIGTSQIMEKEEEALAKVMRAAGFISGKDVNIQEINGYVYDISVNSIELNLLSFGNKGIYRSEYSEVSNLNSITLKEASVIPSLISIKDSYIKDYLILSENVLTEKYFGLKIFSKDGGVLINETIPLIDNWEKQTEYLEPVGNVMRLKLFPLMHNSAFNNSISRITLEEICVTVEQQVDEKEDYVEEEETETELELIVTDDSYTADLITDLTEGIANWVEDSQDFQALEKQITDWAIKDIQNENLLEMVEGIMDGWIGGFGSINIKDFIRDDGMNVPYDIYWAYEVQYDTTTNQGYVTLVNPNLGIDVSLLKPDDQARGLAVNLSNLHYNISNMVTSAQQYTQYYNNYQVKLLSNTSNTTYTTIDTWQQIDREIQVIDSTLATEISSRKDPTSEEICTDFYKITFDSKHFLKVGEYFDFYNAKEQVYIRGIVSSIVDKYTILTPKSYLGEMDSSLLDVDLSENELATVELNTFNIEIFEESKRLFLGKDYLISPDNGSNWYSSIPSGSRINNLIKKARAGDFLIKYKDVNHNNFYIAKYFVSPYQSLSKSNKVLLKNKRVELQKPLSENEGVVNAILIMRNGFKNNYLSPIIYEYSLCAFEDKPKKIKKGLKFNKNLIVKNMRNTTNVN